MIQEPIELIEMPYPTSTPSFSTQPSISLSPSEMPSVSFQPTISSPPSKASTNSPTMAPTDPCSSCPPGATGMFPSTDCVGFFQCSGGEIVSTVTCPSGTLFDGSLCNWPSNVSCIKCGRGVVNDPPPPSPPATAKPSMMPVTSRPTERPIAATPRPTRTATAAPSQGGKNAICGQCDERTLWEILPSADCSGFYSCSFGSQFGLFNDCPQGSSFDYINKACLPSELVKCQCSIVTPLKVLNPPSMPPSRTPTKRPTLRPSSKPSVKPSSSSLYCGECPAAAWGMLPAAGCAGYFQCSNGKAVGGIISCPVGTLYDSRIKGCDYADRVTCDCDSVGMTAEESVEVTPSPTTLQPTPSPVSSFVEPLGICDYGCPDDGSITVRPTRDCSGYYHCSRGIQYGGITACSAGLRFDVNIGGCNWEDLVTCPCEDNMETANDVVAVSNTASIATPKPTAPRTSKPTALPSSPPTEAAVPVTTTSSSSVCPDGITGLYPSSGCKGFYHCQNGMPLGGVSLCGTGTLFDANIQNCNYHYAVTCTVSDPPTQVPTPSPTSRQADNTYMFGMQANTDRPTFLRTPPPTMPPSKAPSPAPTPPPPCGDYCPESGWAILPSKDCKGFYQCNGGVQSTSVTVCPLGQLFDRSIKGCAWKEQFTCDCPAEDLDDEWQTADETQTIDQAVAAPQEVFYPDWSITNSCSNDGKQPDWMTTEYFTMTREDCCDAWFWYDEVCYR